MPVYTRKSENIIPDVICIWDFCHAKYYKGLVEWRHTRTPNHAVLHVHSYEAVESALREFKQDCRTNGYKQIAIYYPNNMVAMNPEYIKRIIVSMFNGPAFEVELWSKGAS